MKPWPMPSIEASVRTIADDNRAVGPKAISAGGSTKKTSAAIPPNHRNSAALAPAKMRRAPLAGSIVISVLEFSALFLDLADQARQRSDFGVEADASPARTGLNRDDEQRPRARRVEFRAFRRDHRRQDTLIAGDLQDVAAARAEPADDVRQLLIARRLDQRRLVVEVAQLFDPCIGGEIVGVERADDAHDRKIGWRITGKRANRDRIEALAAIFERQSKTPLGAAQKITLAEWRLPPKSRQGRKERVAVPRRLVEEGGVVVRDLEREFVLRRALRPAYPGGQCADRALISADDRHLRREAETDNVVGRLLIRADRPGIARRNRRPAKALPKSGHAREIVETGLGRLACHAGKVRIGVDDVPFGIT